MTPPGEKAALLLRILSDCASAGMRCPTNVDLSIELDQESVSGPVKLMKQLERSGLIKVTRFQCARVVTILETDQSTAAPRHQTTHWRDTRPAQKAA